MANGWTWNTLGPGAGGWVTSLDMHADGTFVARTDTNGAYCYNSATGLWEQMMTVSGLPSDMQDATGSYSGAPCYDVRIAPSNSSTFYACYWGFVLKSTNKGVTWTKTAFPVNGNLDGNNANRDTAYKMAIDPLDANVVYCDGMDQGLKYTLNGGTSWATASGVPTTTPPNAIYVAVDPSSSTVNGRKNRVYAHAAGSGLYVTENAGGATPTWALVAGGPATTRTLQIGADGTVYVTADLNDWRVKRYRSGAWADLVPIPGSPAAGFGAVLPHPTDATKLALVAGGPVYYSADAQVAAPTFATAAHPNITSTADDIPWLKIATTNGYGVTALNTGHGCWDRQTAGRIWVGDGVGIWHCDALPPAATNWISRSKGVEQICTLGIICPGAVPISHNMDRAVFRYPVPGAALTDYGPDHHGTIEYGYSCDYASSDPAFVGITSYVFIGSTFWSPQGRHQGETFAYSSTDEGVTWTKKGKVPGATDPFTPSTGWGGGMACATPSNWIITQQHNGNAIGTTDGGLTWTSINLTAFGIPLSTAAVPVDAGWGWTNFNWRRRRASCADRVHHENGGTFYLWNYGIASDIAGTAGIYRSKTGPFGTWEKIYSGNLHSYAHMDGGIKCVHGKSGHLFQYYGPEGYAGEAPGGGGLYYCRNAYTATSGSPIVWTQISDFVEVADVGFGAPDAGKDYPTVFITACKGVGWGVYMASATDAQWAANTVTWLQIAGLADINRWSNGLVTIAGNMSRYGEVYGGGGGNGYVFATMDGAPPIATSYYRPYARRVL